MEFNRFLDSIEALARENQRGDLFGDSSSLEAKAEAFCADFLRSKGYSVRNPIRYPFKIEKLDDLLLLFSSLVQKFFSENLAPYTNSKRDRKIAKYFVEKRMQDDGIDKKTALRQCGQIIYTVFENIDKFKLEGVPSFTIFGQQNMGWITDKALQLMNEKIKHEAEINLEAYVRKLETEEPPPDDGGYSIEELKAAEKRLEAKYGKEKGEELRFNGQSRCNKESDH